jgi:pimeloyl-ACP methyl ester carboxylesterase
VFNTLQSYRRNLTIDSYLDSYTSIIVPNHKISYLDFGDQSNSKVVICAHGLTRNAYDFGKIGLFLSDRYRVVALDYPGRGESDRFVEDRLYNYNVYIQDSLYFLEGLGVSNKTHKVSWIGTSMGGIIGMSCGAKYPEMFSSIILNDIGPFIHAGSLYKIIKYASEEPVFNDTLSAKRYLKKIYSGFGISRDEDWNYMTLSSFIADAQGKLRMNYDPRIVPRTMAYSTQKDVDLWKTWKALKCRISLIYGKNSDILLKETIDQMHKSKNFESYRVDDAAHAPALNELDQMNWIADRLVNT